MGLLGVLHPRRVAPRRRRQERRAVVAGDRRPHGLQRLVGQHDGIGSHVGDVAALVQALRHTHDLRRRPAQLPAALLLQRRRHERCLRLRSVRLVLDTADGERGRLEGGGERTCGRLVEGDHVPGEASRRVEVLARGDSAPVDGDEGGGERRRRRRRQLDVPVAGGHEGDAFALAFDDEPHRRALHPPGREPAVDPPPQHGGHLVAVQAVEDASRLGRVDESVVDAPRVVHRLVDRRRGDLVEDHPLHRHLRLEVLEEVPADRLTLAILVRREVQLAGVLQRGAQLLDDLGAALGQLVGRLEPVVDVDGEALRRQVGDVADRGAHIERVAEELGDRLGLRR